MARPDHVVDLAAKAASVHERYSPRIVAEFNGMHVKVAAVEGPFEWHVHDDTDEVFLVLEGAVDIEVEGRPTAHLTDGDLYVVPRGVRHRPTADEVARIALIEPADTPNTGDASTAAVEHRI